MDTVGGYGMRFSSRVSKAQEIIKKAKGREYNLIGKGWGNEHETFNMNYEYLLWWLGSPPSKNKAKIQFVIKETKNQVILKEMKN